MVAALCVTEGRGARGNDHVLDPSKLGSEHEARGSLDVDGSDLALRTRRERVECRAVNEIAASLKRVREAADVSKVTIDHLRTFVDDSSFTNECANLITLSEQFA
jgi:hypothetical protein